MISWYLFLELYNMQVYALCFFFKGVKMIATKIVINL